MKKTIIVSCGKHSNGGGLTIVKQLLKLFPHIEYYHKDKKVNIGTYFKNVDELPESENVIFLSHVTGNFEQFKEATEKYSNSRLIHLQIDRIITKSTLGEVSYVGYYFDEVWHYSQSPTMYNGYGRLNLNLKMINLDINSYTFGNLDFKELDEREKLIFTASRFGGFKTTPSFLENIRFVLNDDELFKEYPYFFYGLKYNISKNNGKINGEPGLIISVCDDLKTKKTKEYIEINDEFDKNKIKPNKLNLFTTYNEGDRSEWGNYITYIYTTMAKSRRETNKTTNTRVEKYTPCFTKSIEYVVYEAVDAGVPVLLSKPFMEAACPELLDTGYYYDYIEDIPSKIKDLISDKDKYRDIYFKQKKVFERIAKEANDSIISEINRIEGK